MGGRGTMFIKPHPEGRCAYCDSELPPPRQGPKRVLCGKQECSRKYKRDWRKYREQKKPRIED